MKRQTITIDYLYRYEVADRFRDLENVVSHLEALSASKPGDAETIVHDLHRQDQMTVGKRPCYIT